MLRTHTCGELNISHLGLEVTLCGWVQKSRDLGGLTFVDLRDRYGITQITFNMETDAALCTQARKLGREFVLQVIGKVRERENKNTNLKTGDIEINCLSLIILNQAETPPFTIEDITDGGDDLRMKFRYLDLRRNTIKENLILRHKLAMATRNYLDNQNFIEVETPVLIKSTPEGARDFVVPSRMNPGEFYALPQSPQTFKQLLMVSGFDKYYQLVKCFRDEDLRADRQPEFTQIDCEMSFVNQEDILQTFEGLVHHLFKKIKNLEFHQFPRMAYADAMKYYGNDKPDIRFEMKIVEFKNNTISWNEIPSSDFTVFNTAEYIGGICVSGCASYTRKQLDELTDFVKKPQLGGNGLIYIRFQEDGSLKSSIDKYFDQIALSIIANYIDAKPGDLILLVAGDIKKSRKILSELRLEMGTRLGLRNPDNYACLWVTDFPLFEYNHEDNRYYAMHHPFTAPVPSDIPLLKEIIKNSGSQRIELSANAYDLVINGVEVGGGSIRIHDRDLQADIFSALGFSDDEAQRQFGFLMNAFRYGAPPHAGIAFGFDRLCSLFGGSESIRDYIAFPKNNAGRDTMIDAPSPISSEQLIELSLKIS